MIGEGVYFGLDANIYHEAPYLSASGIKSLLVSPLEFWTFSHMNPKKPKRDTDALKIGNAYHKRILEGRAAFYDEFVAEFDRSDYPHALDTATDIREVMRDKGLKLSGNKPELISRLRESDPTIEIMDDIYNNWLKNEAKGKTIVSKEVVERIEISAAMIENDPQLGKCFTGGYPEVSVIWQENGVFFKARLDYLKPRAIVDLKTFENFKRKNVESAIYGSMANEKYHIQASFYMEQAAKAIVRLVKQGKVFGCHDKEFLSKLSKAQDHDFYFVFQQKGLVNIARGAKFPRNSMFSCGQVAIEEAITIYKRCLETFGTDPWIDTSPIFEMDDGRFPVYATEL